MKTENLILLGVLGYIGISSLRPQEPQQEGGGGGLGGITFPAINFPAFNIPAQTGLVSGGGYLGALQGLIDGMLSGASGQAEDLLAGARGQAEDLLAGARERAAELVKQGLLDQGAALVAAGKEKAADLLAGAEGLLPGGDAEVRSSAIPGWGPDPWADWVEWVTRPLSTRGLSLRSLAIQNAPIPGGSRAFLFPWETPRGEGFVFRYVGWSTTPRTWRDVWRDSGKDSGEEPMDWEAIDARKAARFSPDGDFTEEDEAALYQSDMELLAKNAPALLTPEELEKYS